MTELVRPRHLAPGDTVAVLSPSWGGPDAFPHVYDHGLAVLRRWGLEVREWPSTRAAPEDLRRDPRRRADDLHAAFADPSVRAIVASIGGDDSIRLLPFLDQAVITAHPTILLGYSDTTTLLAAVRRLGIVTFHGPAIMAGFSQMASLPPAFEAHVRQMLFEPAAPFTYPRYPWFVDGYRDWRDPSLVGLVGEPRPDHGPRVLQGSGRVAGELFGGCIEVLDWLRGSWAFPTGDEWTGRILFLETSEEKPSPVVVERIVRALGAQGVLEQISAILVGRARDHSAAESEALWAAIASVVSEEFGRADLPIVADLPFGHTDPQWLMPLGVRAELDVERGSLTLLEPWLE